MNYSERAYLVLMDDILASGDSKEDRTGVGTFSKFMPPPLKFWNVDTYFPLMTTKKMAWKSILAETLWFVQGRYDLESLRADGCHWWDDWEREDGTLGRVYGAQLRHWLRPDGTEFDQLAWVINEIKTNPRSRRLVMTMWNAGELDNMALPPCHGALIQFYAREEGSRKMLDLMVHIRSSDVFLGLPTNIAGYALLLKMVGHVTGREADILTVSLGDAHVYKNHVAAVLTQTPRTPAPFPQVIIDPTITNIDDLRPEHFTLEHYNPQPKISAPIAV